MARGDSSTGLREASMVSSETLFKPKAQNEKNDLSSLIPGYRAPLRLTMSSSSSTREESTKPSLNDLHEHAELNTFCTAKNASIGQVRSFKTGRLSKRSKASAASASLGDRWHGFRPTPYDPADLALIRNRNYLDPKRFYKSGDVQSGKRKNMVQVGTVIEGAAEFYSSRLTKKQKRSSFTAEILADKSLSGYVHDKFRNMQQQKTAQNQKAKRNKRTKGRK